MAEAFFELLRQELQRAAGEHGRVSVSPEVLKQLYQDFPKSPAAVATPTPPTAAVRTPPPPRASPAPRSASEPAPVRRDSAPLTFPGESAAPEVAQADWEQLAEAVRNCRRCRLCEHRTQTVLGEGNPKARLMFIGEGPGFEEDRQGRPFVGRAGQLLDKMIAAMGFRREEVYIGNIVKCRPPGNRDPEPEEAASCLPYLRRQIALIEPEVIVTLGRVPLVYLLEKHEGITRIHGRWLAYAGIPVLPTFHPAFLLRQESAKRDAWNDLKLAMKALGMPLPPPKR